MIVVIYHKADFDGKFCREIARKRFGDSAQYIGWDYGDPTPDIPDGSELYMLDISVDALMGYEDLTWVDHHKTAIEKYGPKKGVQIDGVAACRLAWAMWFGDCPFTKQNFLDRAVLEPLAVRLTGEYDIWDKRDPRTDQFQFGLRSVVLDDSRWEELLSKDAQRSDHYANELCQKGLLIKSYQESENASTIKNQGFTLRFEGKTFLAVNAARYNSLLFTSGLKPEHDGCIGFNYDGEKWKVGIYGVPSRPDEDFTPIAIKYGGGGHKQACGFTAPTLPWLSLGATGNFPYGKLDEEDEGELRMACVADKSTETVILDFGKPVAYIGMRPEHAEQIAKILIENAKKARK